VVEEAEVVGEGPKAHEVVPGLPQQQQHKQN
jgi:hypothetical protein